MEYLLNRTDLEALQDALMADGSGYNNRLSLTKSQFCEAGLCILCKGNFDQWAELYDKVDAMKTGRVDWDKFANHMMSVLMEKDDRVRSTKIPQWKKPKILACPHKDLIQSVLYLRNSGKYLAISKDGCVTTWDTTLHLSRTLRAVTDSCKVKDVWVTSSTHLPNINKLAVTFTSKEIAVYDLSTKQSDFPCQYRIRGLPHVPICIDYWYDPENSNNAVLIWGDTGGFITLIQFTSASIALFERPIQPANQKQVRYSSNLSCIISCATKWTDSLVIGWIEKDTVKPSQLYNAKPPAVWRVSRKSSIEISQGVNAFDYHSRMNLLVTAGVNTHVCLWNPYVVSKPTGVLRGHMTSVVQVAFLPSRNQLASFSKDKVLRIWDIQLQICLQRVAGVFKKGPEANTLLYYDDQLNRLFVTLNNSVMVLEIRIDPNDRIKTHDKPVQCVLYNSSLHQVVSGGQEGTLVVWMVDSGQKVKQFSILSRDDNDDDDESTGGADIELTSLSHDHSKTRLITAASDGFIKIWDYNGYCYHTLCCNTTDKPAADIGQILSLKRSILVAGLSKQLMVFYESSMNKSNTPVYPGEWKSGQAHSDEILSLAFSGVDTLATGSYDGEIIIWNNSSELLSKRLKSRSRSFLNSTRLPALKVSRSSGKNLSAMSDFGYAVTRLIFLPNMAGKMRGGVEPPNLVSCGGNGWVRFWKTSSSDLMSEFIAHDNGTSIIMALDNSGDWLATADTDGFIKIWNLSQYFYLMEAGVLLKDTPLLRSQFRPHVDLISTVEFCLREDQLLVLSASFDCSVALSDLSGTLIGVFGQEFHWKIEAKPIEEPINIETVDTLDKEEEEVRSVSSQPVSSRAITPDSRATTDPEHYRINVWDVTYLGKEYKEQRELKRERRQLEGVQSALPYQSGCDRLNKYPMGPHSSLQMATLEDLHGLEKPDFINNPDKYFSHRFKSDFSSTRKELMTVLEMPRAPFDENSLFPKSILGSQLNSFK